jgi:superfamily II DNA or RNA helicase
MSLYISIENAKKEMNDIMDAINDKSDDKIIFDSYDTLNSSLLKSIKEKDDKWITKFFKVVKNDLLTMLEGKKELTLRDIRNYLEDKYKDTEKRQLIDYIVDLICIEDDKFYLKKNKKINKEEEFNDDDDNQVNQDKQNDPVINIPLEEIIKFEGFRDNQTKAIDETKNQNYISGVHDQIMGAGKTFIILKLIWEHYKKYGGNQIYPIICYRQEILKDLFFDKDNNVDENKKNLWKKYDIIDLDKFKIIDKINNKDKEIKNSKSKPNILLINTDFLRAIDKANDDVELDYYVFDYDRIAYITLDECHGISANNLYDILKKIKYEHKKHIIGFSATVLRDGAEKKLVDIFSSSLDKNENKSLINNKRLNIISRYDFMDAIRDNIIVPPYYTIMEVNKTVKNKIGNSNKEIIENVLKELFEKLPYKKIICWCRTIQQMKDYYDFFKKIFKDYKIYCSSSHDDILRDKYNINDKEFFDSNGMSIMICVNRFREGSDIKNLDMGVYLDRVKKRTILVAMQTSGRVLRVDKLGKKTHGFIIDCLINDNTDKIEILTARLILSYYNKILSLADDDIENKKNLDNYKVLLNKISESEYDEKEKELTVKLDDDKEMKIKLKLTTKSFDWKYLKNILIEDVNKIYDISKEEKFNQIIEKLKKRQQFNVECDFWETYKNLDKDKYDLPENLYEEYKEFFDENTWFELLDYDISGYYKTKQECINSIKQLDKYHNGQIDEETYIVLRKKDKKIPPNPIEYFKKSGFTTIEKEFNINTKKNIKFANL